MDLQTSRIHIQTFPQKYLLPLFLAQYNLFRFCGRFLVLLFGLFTLPRFRKPRGCIMYRYVASNYKDVDALWLVNITVPLLVGPCLSNCNCPLHSRQTTFW